MSDLIDRQAAIDALHMHLMYRLGTDSNKKRLDEWINSLPSAQPEKRTEERAETHACDLEAELVNAGDKTSKSYWALQAAYLPASVLPPAQPEQQWIPVTERLPNHELALVQYSDGDFDLLQFPTAYRRKDIVAWQPLPAPYEERREE